MIKKLRLICLIVCICLIGLTPISANALSNLNFEESGYSTGYIPGWIPTVDSLPTNLWTVVDTGGAKEGTKYLQLTAGYGDPDDINYPTALKQQFNSSDVNALSGYVKTSDNLYFTDNDTSDDVYAFIIIMTSGEEKILEYIIAGTSWWIKEENGYTIDSGNNYSLGGWNLWTLTNSNLATYLDANTDYYLEYGITFGDNTMVASFDAVPTGVPEPATLILLMAGLAGIGVARRRLN